MSRQLLRIAGIVAIMFLKGGIARAGIIDTFTAVEGNNPDSVTTTGPAFGTPVNFVINPTVTDPVGSQRRLQVNQFDGNVNSSASLTIDGNGTAALTSTSNATSVWSILYGLTFPGLHYDATAGGADRFRLTLSSYTPGTLEYVIFAQGYTGGGTSNNGTYQLISSNVIDVPFSSFSGNANFADLNQITIQVQNTGLTRGGSLVLDQFETTTAAVPEPGAVVLSGLGVVTLLVGRRWRRVAPLPVAA